MTNLLAETREAITDSGHTIEDIVFIGSTTPPAYECSSWAEFERLADFDYDAGFGAAYIPGDLRVVFRDGSDLHRGEYDGSEWWEFSRQFERPTETRPIRTLRPGDHLWPSLADLHEDDDAGVSR